MVIADTASMRITIADSNLHKWFLIRIVTTIATCTNIIIAVVDDNYQYKLIRIVLLLFVVW